MRRWWLALCVVASVGAGSDTRRSGFDFMTPETQAIQRDDAQNPAALKRLVGGGTQLRGFSREILVAAYKASLDVYKEANEKSPAFRKIYDSMTKFREEQLLWFRVAEKGFDDFMHVVQTIK